MTWRLNLPYSFAALTFGIQWGFFLLHGWPQRSEKLYDASGSLTHLALVFDAVTLAANRAPRQTVNGLLAVIWCTRLGTFLFNRIARDSKDDRFTELKKNFFSFSIAWNMQVAWVFLLELPILICNANSNQPALGWPDGLGWGLWGIGFLLQCVADAEKFSFRSDPANRNKFITTGTWRYSRHPNYFGEMLMWAGISCSCAASFQDWQWLGLVSPFFDAFLLLCVSGVPLLEKAGEEKWGHDPAYRHYMQNTSCIVPWFPAPALTVSDGSASPPE